MRDKPNETISKNKHTKPLPNQNPNQPTNKLIKKYKEKKELLQGHLALD